MLLMIEEIGHIVEDFLERAVHPLLVGGLVKRPHLAVVVADATADSYEDAILYSGFYNPEEQEPQYSFQNFAEMKAEVSWRTGLSTRVVVQLHPEMLQNGDIRYAGAIVYGGFVVAVSGLDDFDDEAIALQIAVELWRAGMMKMKNVPVGQHFIDLRA